jgi:endonuclease-3
LASKKVSPERVRFISKTLNRLFTDPQPPLDHTDHFTLLVAVLLSAQTTDKKVNEVTPELFRRAATPEQMAKLSVSEIQSIIRQVGLAPQKAKALKGLAERLVTEFHSQVPKTREELESLPGVGRKTASVVLSQAFSIPSFPVDTHIHRLAMRWGLSRGKNVLEVEVDLKELFPEKDWNKLHLQIIFYGRQHCGARQCDGNRCEICAWCRAEEAQRKAPARRRISSNRSYQRSRS